MSIQNQVEFLCRSVCDYDENIGLPQNLRSGFVNFSELLRTVYKDFKSYETSEKPDEMTKIGISAVDLENFHNISYTIWCLYAIAQTGELSENGLHVKKDVFKTVYKKETPIVFIFSILEKYGFSFNYYKNEKETDSYKNCNNFVIFYENNNLIEAIKFIAEKLGEIKILQNSSKEMSEMKTKMTTEAAFMIADYHYISMGKMNQNPIRENILRITGKHSLLWQKIVCFLQEKLGLTIDFMFMQYVYPYWTVHFKQKNKILCKFEISADCIKMWISMPLDNVKDFIIKTGNFEQNIFTNVTNLNCAPDCGECEQTKKYFAVCLR